MTDGLRARHSRWLLSERTLDQHEPRNDLIERLTQQELLPARKDVIDPPER